MIPTEALPGIAIGLLTAGTALALIIRQGRAEQEALTDIASRYGLEARTYAWWERERVAEGTWEGRPLVIRSYMKGSGKSSHRRHQIGLGGAPFTIKARAQGMLDNVLQAVGQSDTVTGDASFDAATVFALEDPNSLLDADARAAVLHWTTVFEGTIEDGALKADRRGRLSRGEVGALVDGAKEVVRALERGVATTPDAIAAIATDDPVPAVRAEAVRILIRIDRQRGQQVAERLLDDPSGLVRAVSADLVGVRGVPTARALLSEPTSTDAERAIALRVLALDPNAEADLLPWIDAQHTATRLAAIHGLARVGTVAAVEPLLVHARALLGGAVKAAANEAVATIQGRLVGADHGHLSLAEPARGGELSVADAQAGALSTVAKPIAG